MAEAAATRNGARRSRVVILGGGFAGINAAMELAKLPVDITIVDRKNYHLFQPLLYQVAQISHRRRSARLQARDGEYSFFLRQCGHSLRLPQAIAEGPFAVHRFARV